MTDEQKSVMIPVEQAMVPFYDREIVAVRLPDGRIAAVLASMCDALQLLTRGQARRIRADPIIAEFLVPVRVDTAGGPQTMDVLVAWAIPRWLTGIRLGMVAPEKRPAIEAFQREAADVLYRYFSQVRTTLPALPSPQSVVSAHPQLASQITQIVEQIDTMSGAVNLMREHLAALLSLPSQVEGLSAQMSEAVAMLESLAERQDVAAAQLADTDTRLAAVDARTQRLTPAHTRQVQEMVDRIVRETRRLPMPLTYAIIYGRLKHRFRVGSYKGVADSRFEELMTYLREELQRATEGQATEQGSLF
jgi:hypothetical protein